MASSSPSKGTTGPALAAELGKAEARQAKNLWVTTKAIDGLADRIARAKRDLESRRSGASVGSAKGSGAGTAAGGSERAGRKPSAQAAVAAAAAAAASDSSATTPTKLKPTASKPSPSASPSSRSPCMSSPSKPASKGSAKPPTSRAAVAAAAAAAITSVASEGGASDGGATGRQKADAMELERGVEASGAGSGSGAGMGMGASGGVLAGLARDVEGMKPLETVGSEHKNFHATISKLAKAAEKVCDICAMRGGGRGNGGGVCPGVVCYVCIGVCAGPLRLRVPQGYVQKGLLLRDGWVGGGWQRRWLATCTLG